MPGMPPYGPRWMQGEFLRPVRSFLSWLVLFSIHAIYLPAIYLSIYHYIILYTQFISRISVCLSWLVCLSEVIQSQVSNQAWNWLICASSWSGAKKNDMLEFHGISLYIYIARRWTMILLAEHLWQSKSPVSTLSSYLTLLSESTKLSTSVTRVTVIDVT